MRAVFSSLLVASALHICNARADGIDLEHLMSACPGAVSWMQQEKSADKSKSASDSVSDPKLRATLLRMESEDQSVRHLLSGTPDAELLRRESEVDQKHLKDLQKIVATRGVPTLGKVGSEGIHAFWTLIQHADDVPLQKQVLHTFESGDFGIAAGELATLADKIRINEHRPQLYGTQFHIEGGSLVPNPIENPQGLDARRAKMALMPLADYACMLNALSGFPTPTK